MSACGGAEDSLPINEHFCAECGGRFRDISTTSRYCYACRRHRAGTRAGQARLF